MLAVFRFVRARWFGSFRGSHRGVRPRFVPLSLTALEDRYAPAANTLIWVGDDDGDVWSDMDNWKNSAGQNVAPQSINDDTLIFGGTLGNVTGSNKDSKQDMAGLRIRKLIIHPAYDKVITLDETLNVGVDGNNNNLDEAFSSGSMANGTIDGDAEFRIKGGTFTWGGGKWSGGANADNTIIESRGRLNIQLNPTALARDLVNEGKVYQTLAADLVFYSHKITNALNAEWTVDYTGGFTKGTEGGLVGAFENKGTFRKAGSSGSLSLIDLNFWNKHDDALLDVRPNTKLWFTQEIEQEQGTTKIQNKATLKTSGTFVVKAGSLYGSVNSTVTGNLEVRDAKFYVGGKEHHGTFTVSNNYTQTAGEMVIDVIEVEPGYDKLVVGNTVKLGGMSELVVNTVGAAPTSNLTIIQGTRDPNNSDFDDATFNGHDYFIDLTDNTKYVLVPEADEATISSLSPETDTATGGIPVYITGTNLTGTTAVYFGGTAATDWTVHSSTSLTVIVPAHAVGEVDVSVVTPGGESDPCRSPTPPPRPPPGSAAPRATGTSARTGARTPSRLTATTWSSARASWLPFRSTPSPTPIG